MFFQSKSEEFTENLGKILEKCLRGISLFSKVAGCMIRLEGELLPKLKGVA